MNKEKMIEDLLFDYEDTLLNEFLNDEYVAGYTDAITNILRCELGVNVNKVLKPIHKKIDAKLAKEKADKIHQKVEEMYDV